MDFPKELFAEQTRLNLTQEQLGDIVGYSGSAIGQYIRRELKPPKLLICAAILATLRKIPTPGGAAPGSQT